jgi:2-phospho-L-lactate guanylyltransferase (CobY/MobA/RfbA family)
MRKHFAKTMLMTLVMLTVLFASAFSAAAESNVYEVLTDDELSTALQTIADSEDTTEATIVLKADVNAPVTAEGSYTTTFGVDGKHITVKSDEGGGEETFLSRVWNSERRLHL